MNTAKGRICPNCRLYVEEHIEICERCGYNFATNTVDKRALDDPASERSRGSRSKTAMKIIGIILIILQCLGIFGSFAVDYARGDPLGSNLIQMFTFTNLTSVAYLLGYFSFSIIGIILLVKANGKQQK